MRILILAGLFFACFMYFRSTEEKNLYSQVTTSRPSLSRLATKAILKADVPRDEVSTFQAAVRPLEEVAPVEKVSVAPARELAVEEPVDAEQVEIAWDEINNNWQTELKDYLFSVDPQRAEQIFEAYMKAGSTYRETPDDSKSDDVVAAHQENLKEVFGAHFEAIQSLHQEYVNSVQDQAGPETQLLLQL